MKGARRLRLAVHEPVLPFSCRLSVSRSLGRKIVVEASQCCWQARTPSHWAYEPGCSIGELSVPREECRGPDGYVAASYNASKRSDMR